jgi:hypothetical protein
MYTDAQMLKFALLSDGVRISPQARAVLATLTRDGRLSPADYASTSGLILRLAGREWVNAPISDHNPNFVTESPYTFDIDDDGFVVHGGGMSASAEFWPLPAYHGRNGIDGVPLTNYVVSHGDRARLSPTIGCSFECTFCNIPYDDVYAGVKPIEGMLHAIRTALTDIDQPARHLLISGGTPSAPHVPAMRHVYETVLESAAGVDVDIMMVPIEGLFDLPRLNALGLHQLSINLEVWNEGRAKSMMRHKFRQGRQSYLDFLESAAAELGGSRVRSMLMVGLEPLEDTLAGVTAIAERGCTPVLSPFRPDPVTPLSQNRPPDAEQLRHAYESATEIASSHGVELGPVCDPCTHNTLAFSLGGEHTNAPALVRGAP